jgi:hypothetical protein
MKLIPFVDNRYLRIAFGIHMWNKWGINGKIYSKTIYSGYLRSALITGHSKEEYP